MAHKIPKYVKKLLSKQKNGLIKIDLGGGKNPQNKFINIDRRRLKNVDIVHDLETTPWPLPDNCATLVMASHIVEHINPAKEGFIKFMDECWRVLKIGGQMMIATPYAGSEGYWSDPTHCNPCTVQTWGYFDPENTGNLYEVYKPKPWRVVQCFFQSNGNMEVLLQKRSINEK